MFLVSLLTHLLSVSSILYCAWYFIRKKNFLSKMLGMFLAIFFMFTANFFAPSILAFCIIIYEKYIYSKINRISLLYFNGIGYILFIFFLEFLLLGSIFFSSQVSEQINNTLLGNFDKLNLNNFIINIGAVSIIFFILINLLNLFVLRFFNSHKKIYFTNYIDIFIFIIFLFIISIYSAKYLSIVFVYTPYIFVNSLFPLIMESYPSIIFSDTFKSQMQEVMLKYIISKQADIGSINQELSNIFAIIIVLIFLFIIIKRYNLRLNDSVVAKFELIGEFFKKNKYNTKYHKNFLNDNYAKYFYRIYSYKFIITNIALILILTYYLINDSTFSNNSFIYLPFKYHSIILVYLYINSKLDTILDKFKEHHEFKITNFIEKNLFYKYMDFLMAYLSIGLPLLFTIASRNIYYVLEKYGAIRVPENIQTMNYMILFFFLTFIILNPAEKYKNNQIKKLENE